jgi:hypothetical protein
MYASITYLKAMILKISFEYHSVWDLSIRFPVGDGAYVRKVEDGLVDIDRPKS